MECGGEFIPSRDIYPLQFFCGNHKAFIISVLKRTAQFFTLFMELLIKKKKVVINFLINWQFLMKIFNLK